MNRIKKIILCSVLSVSVFNSNALRSEFTTPAAFAVTQFLRSLDLLKYQAGSTQTPTPKFADETEFTAAIAEVFNQSSLSSLSMTDNTQKTVYFRLPPIDSGTEETIHMKYPPSVLVAIATGNWADALKILKNLYGGAKSIHLQTL